MRKDILKKMSDKGFTCIGDNGIGASYWFQGKHIKDFWMWTRKIVKYIDGSVQIQTVKVTDLREAALHYWKDKWVPVKPITNEMLRAMEDELRNHRGLQKQNVQFPQGEFLDYAFVPEEYLVEQDFSSKERVNSINKKVLANFRIQKQTGGNL